MVHDPKVDAYIAASADFARPILSHIRALVHGACPEVDEAIKWGFPHFVYRTKNLAAMAAFKGHVAVNLWYSDEGGDREGMGHLGKVTVLSDLPADDDVRALLAKAAMMIDAGEKPPRMQRQPREALPVPAVLSDAIAAVPQASAVWAAFPPGKVRDYAEWVGEAKSDATREKRVAQAVEWIAQGKGRNWKYEKG